jgi:hypothetical protein
MSAYRNQYLVSNQVDPVFFNNNRCVFRLPHMVVLKRSVALGELGFVSAPKQYTMIGGVSNIIRSISLNVGGTQLDFNNRVAITNTLSNLRTTGSRANNVDSVTKKTGLDFKSSVLTNATDKGEFLVSSNFSNQANSGSGTVYLHEVLRFFLAKHNVQDVSEEFLPLNMFKNQNIELTIEWENNPQIISTQTAAINTFTQPVLLFDAIELSSPVYEALNSIKQPILLKYDTWQTESLIYGAGGNLSANVVSTQERLNQCNGKMLKRVALLNQGSDVVNDLGLVTKSTALPNEKIQLIVNGRSLFDYRLEDSAEKVSNFVNVWGDYVSGLGGRQFNFDAGNYLTNKTSNNQGAGQASAIVGNASLMGAMVNKRVEYMDVDISHTGSGDPNVDLLGGRYNFIFETDNMLIVAPDGTFSLGF